MSKSDNDDLWTRAYGPGQPPLTDAEHTELLRRRPAFAEPADREPESAELLRRPAFTEPAGRERERAELLDRRPAFAEPTGPELEPAELLGHRAAFAEPTGREPAPARWLERTESVLPAFPAVDPDEPIQSLPQEQPDARLARRTPSPRRTAVSAVVGALILAGVAAGSAAVGFAAGSSADPDSAASSVSAGGPASAASDTTGSTSPNAPAGLADPDGRAEPEKLGDGISAADGSWLAFADAHCNPVLSVENGGLAGVVCTWPDGHRIALGADGAVATDTTALRSAAEEAPFRLTPP